MSNFYRFEKILIRCLIGLIHPNEATDEICGLPEKQKVDLVTNRNESDILSFLEKCLVELRSLFPANAEFSLSANNMLGNDIYESVTNTHIEIKSGPQMTDANCGLKIVSWALDDENDFIKSNMTEGMRARRKIHMDGGSVEEIEQSKNRQMDTLSDFLIQQTRNGFEPKLSHFFKSISRGITKGNAIITNYAETISVDFPLKLMCDWTCGLVEYDKSFHQNETISLVSVGETDKRCQLVVVGQRSRVKAKLYPNYKNSFKLDNEEKIPACYWVQTPCFHVWIKDSDN